MAERQELTPRPAETYVQGLIDSYLERSGTLMVESYFKILTELETPEAVAFLVSETENQESRAANKAFEALERLEPELALIPLARKYTPELTGNIPEGTSKLKDLTFEQKSRLLAKTVIKGVATTSDLRRSPPQRAKAATLLTEMALAAILEATQEEPQEKFLQAAGIAYGSSFQPQAEAILIAAQDESVPILAEHLNKANVYGRTGAFATLARINTDLAWKTLAEEQEKIETINQAGMELVAAKGDSRFYPLVLQSLTGGRGCLPKASPEVIDYLFANTPNEDKEKLVPVLARHLTAIQPISEKAAEILLAIRTESSLRVLTRALQRTSHPIAPIQEYLDAQDPAELDGQKAIGSLLEALLAKLEDHKTYKAVLAILTGSEAMNTPGGRVILDQRLEEALRRNFEESKKLNYRLTSLVADLKREDLLPLLWDLMNEEEGFTAAGKAIAEMGTPAALSWLIGAVKGKDPTGKVVEPEIKSKAAQVLQYFPFEELESELPLTTQMPPEQADILAKLTGGELRSPRQKVIGALYEAVFQNTDFQTKKQAIGSLGKICDPLEIRPLFELLKNPDLAASAVDAISTCWDKSKIT